MAQSQRTVAWPESHSTAALATLVYLGFPARDVYDPDRISKCTLPGEYEVTVTLKVRGHDLEDVVARTFADPHCVDVRVQSAPWLAYRGDEVGEQQVDDRVSQRRKA